jgi:hypothetical protein
MCPKFLFKRKYYVSSSLVFILIFIFLQNNSLSLAEFSRKTSDEIFKKVYKRCHDVLIINQSSKTQTELSSEISDEEICQALTKFIVDAHKTMPTYTYDSQVSQIIFAKRGTQLTGLEKNLNSNYFLGPAPRETDMRPLVFFILKGYYRIPKSPEYVNYEKWNLGRYNYSTGVLNVRTGEPVAGSTSTSIKSLCGVLLDCTNIADVPQFRSLLNATNQEIRQYLVDFHKIVSLERQKPPQVLFMRRVQAEEIPKLDRTYDMVKQHKTRKHLLFAVLKGGFRVKNVPEGVNPEQWLADRFNYTSVVLDLKTGEMIDDTTTETQEPFCGALGCAKGSEAETQRPVIGL